MKVNNWDSAIFRVWIVNCQAQVQVPGQVRSGQVPPGCPWHQTALSKGQHLTLGGLCKVSGEGQTQTACFAEEWRWLCPDDHLTMTMMMMMLWHGDGRGGDPSTRLWAWARCVQPVSSSRSLLRHEKLLHVCDRSGRLILNDLTGTCHGDAGNPPQLLSVVECLTHLNLVAILKTQLGQKIMLLLRNADIINANICDNSVMLTASAARVRLRSMLATEPWLRCGSDPVTHLTRREHSG